MGTRLLWCGRIPRQLRLYGDVFCKQRRAVHVKVSPSSCLVDQCPRIQVLSAASNVDYTLRASFNDDANRLVSYGHFKSSMKGEIDLKQDPSLGGTYTGIDGAGLLWSVQAKDKKPAILRVKNVDQPLEMTITVHLGRVNAEELERSEVLASCLLDRLFLSKDMEKYEVSAGRLRGYIFKPPGSGPFPGVIDMFGSAGGLKMTRAAILASYGFATYALPYFAYKDLVKNVGEVELEYFQEAVNWFSSQKYVKTPAIGFIGTSLGAEISLIISTMMPDKIRAVVCYNVSHHMVLSPLMYKGEHLPFVEYDASLLDINEDGEINASNAIAENLRNADESTAIQIEKATADFLFIAGEDDQIYDSYYCASKLVERLNDHGHHNHTFVSYPGSGHQIDTAYLPVASKTMHPMIGALLINGGCDPAAHAHAQQDSWTKAKAFLKDKLT